MLTLKITLRGKARKFFYRIFTLWISGKSVSPLTRRHASSDATRHPGGQHR
jgi:hypothetical protein